MGRWKEVIFNAVFVILTQRCTRVKTTGGREWDVSPIKNFKVVSNIFVFYCIFIIKSLDNFPRGGVCFIPLYPIAPLCYYYLVKELIAVAVVDKTSFDVRLIEAVRQENEGVNTVTVTLRNKTDLQKKEIVAKPNSETSKQNA